MINKKVSSYVSLGKYTTFSDNRPFLCIFLSGFLTFFNSFILIQLLLQSNLWLIFKISVSLADKYKKQII